MRISAPQLRFHDEDLRSADPGHIGWFVSATDADQDNQLWTVPDSKITPAQAMVIAAAFDSVLTENLGRQINHFTKGVEAQNRYAAKRAAEAVTIALATAERARLRAEALASWDIPTEAARIDEDPS